MRWSWLLGALGMINLVADASAEPPMCGSLTPSVLSWSMLETLGGGPSVRSSPSVVAIDGSLFVFGGVFDDFGLGENQFYNDMHRLNLETATWLRLDASVLPAARAFAPAAVDARRSRMILFGGSRYSPDFNDIQMFDDLWAFDPATTSWEQLLPANLGPSARASASTWVFRGTFYVFGGIEASFVVRNDLWALDLESLTWRQIMAETDQSPAPRRLAQISAVQSNGRLFLYGGEGVQEGALIALNDTWELDLLRERWRQVAPGVGYELVSGRNDGAAGSCGDSFFLVGGDLSGGAAGCGSSYEQNVTNEIWRFERRTRRWFEVDLGQSSPPPLKRTGYAVWDGQMYLISGWGFACDHERDVGQLWNHDVVVFDLGCRGTW